MALLFEMAKVIAYHQHQLGLKVNLNIIFCNYCYILTEAVHVLKLLKFPVPTLNAIKYTIRSSASSGYRFKNLLNTLRKQNDVAKNEALVKDYLNQLPESEGYWRYVTPLFEELCAGYQYDVFVGNAVSPKPSAFRLKRALAQGLGQAMSGFTQMPQEDLKDPLAVYFVLELIKLIGSYGGYAAALLQTERDIFLNRGLKLLDEEYHAPSLFIERDISLSTGKGRLH